MLFLTHGKTNWKFILIVLILAILVGGILIICKAPLPPSWEFQFILRPHCLECKTKFISWCEGCRSYNWPLGIENSPILPIETNICLRECFGIVFPKTVYCEYARKTCEKFGILGGSQLPAEKITIFTDKEEYKLGEIVKITIKNDSNKSIWYRDWCKYKCDNSLCECGDSFFIEKKEDEKYKIYHPLDSIGVEHMSEIVELKPNSEKVYQLELIKFSEGTYRLGFYFGFSKRENPIDATIYSNEFIIKIGEEIKGVIPENYDRESAKIFIDDLNNDGLSEAIISAIHFGSEPGYFKEAYLAIVTIDKSGAYKKIADFIFSIQNVGSTLRTIPGIADSKDLIDIDGDGKKEIVLDLGTGGASNEAYGIFKIDWDLNKINWLKVRKKDGSIENTFFLLGGTVMHQETFRLEDLNNDGIMEIIEKRGEYIGVSGKPEDWKKEENWKWQIRVYKWNGSIFVYDEELCTLLIKTANWRTYRNEEYGFEIKYPEDYFVKEKTFTYSPLSEEFLEQFPPCTKGFLKAKDPFYIFSKIKISSPEEIKIDRVDVEINIYNNPNNLSLNEWLNFWDDLQKKYSACYRVENLPIYDKKAISIAGIKGVQGFGGCCGECIKEIFLSKGNKIYNLSLLDGTSGRLCHEDVCKTCDPCCFSISGKVESIFNQMLSTFRFLE